MPATPQKLETIRAATAADSDLQMVLKCVKSGWPEYVADVPLAIRDYYPVREKLSEYHGIITKGCRMIIPSPLRADILDRFHDGHQGLSKCRERANTSVWGPSISSEIKQKVQNCQVCREMRPTQRKEPLISTPYLTGPGRRLPVICVITTNTLTSSCQTTSPGSSRYSTCLQPPHHRWCRS